MNWRDKNKNRLLKNNATLDSFLIGCDAKKNGGRLEKIRPKIKVPVSSGYEPYSKPRNPVFLYPSYPQFREYQYTIALECVTQNALVCLPTGLGKTHIASVIMFNFHKWFPEGLIFFLAPTRPLVDQQAQSLFRFSHHAPPSCIFTMKGNVIASKRAEAYKKKNIFFCTPQTLENDLKEERLQIKKIVLIIFDEAHRGVGNYSYANIVKILEKYNFGYRIVALSATPGNDSSKIQEVLQNLFISKMIIKSEEDADVKKYIKNRQIVPVFISNTSIIRQTEEILEGYIRNPLQALARKGLFDRYLLHSKHGLCPGSLHVIRTQVYERIKQIPYNERGFAYEFMKFLTVIVHSKQAIKEHGYESFRKKFIYRFSQSKPKCSQSQSYNSESFANGIRSNDEKAEISKHYQKVIRQSQGFKRIQELFINNPNISNHPKLEKLREILVSFFSEKQNIANKSKVIVFAQFRSTCYQIKKYFGQSPYSDVIKAEMFYGQAKTVIQTRSEEGSNTETLQLTQKQQISLIQQYKEGEINTLIATSIGEEGLDIGEVDGIFCYDGGMSIIRLIQRMGRTGRKRNGKVYILLMEGKQSEDYEKVTKKSKKMKKMSMEGFKFYGFNSPMFEQCTQIPIQFFDEPVITVEEAQEKPEKLKSKQSKRATTKQKKSKTKGKKKIEEPLEHSEQEQKQKSGKHAKYFSIHKSEHFTISQQSKKSHSHINDRDEWYDQFYQQNYPDLFAHSDGELETTQISNQLLDLSNTSERIPAIEQSAQDVKQANQSQWSSDDSSLIMDYFEKQENQQNQ